mgnify:FL=1|jgi:hypothetical protein
MIKKLLLMSTLIFALPSQLFADHHALALEARQPQNNLELISIEIGPEMTTIVAEAAQDMSVYGRVYMTFKLSYNSTNTGGTYTFEGRAYPDQDTAISGSGAGIWRRDGTMLVLDQLVAVSNGTVNLDRIVMNPFTRTATIDVYIRE